MAKKKIPVDQEILRLRTEIGYLKRRCRFLEKVISSLNYLTDEKVLTSQLEKIYKEIYG